MQKQMREHISRHATWIKQMRLSSPSFTSFTSSDFSFLTGNTDTLRQELLGVKEWTSLWWEALNRFSLVRTLNTDEKTDKVKHPEATSDTVADKLLKNVFIGLYTQEITASILWFIATCDWLSTAAANSVWINQSPGI